MKKILLLFLLIIIPFSVSAEEFPDITNDIEIRTKWYQEKEVGKYHPKGVDLIGYLENPNKINYSEYSAYSNTYCTLPTENYLISKTHLYKYKYISYTKYLTLTNFEYDNNIAIFYQGNKQTYEIVSNDNNKIILKLPKALSTEYLLFFIDYEKPYNLTLSFDEEQTTIALSKNINGEKVLIPDRTWITDDTNYRTGTSPTNIINNDLVIHMGSSDTCRYKQIYTYRYKIEKVYYDNEYHHYVEGYLPDMTDIKVYYKGEELIKTVEVPVYEKVIEYVTKYQTIEVPKEVIKTIEVPKEIIKTVEIPVETIKTVEVCSNNEPSKEPTSDNSSSSNSECPPQTITDVITIEQIKEIIQVPKQIYLLIFTLASISIVLIVLLIKKYVVRK